jgi:hypothetical protein
VGWRFLVFGAEVLHLKLRIGKRDEQNWSLAWGTMGQSMGWWFDEPFLTIPNRLVFLALLCARRPAHVKVEVVGLVRNYLPWDLDWEGLLPLAHAEGDLIGSLHR